MTAFADMFLSFHSRNKRCKSSGVFEKYCNGMDILYLPCVGGV